MHQEHEKYLSLLAKQYPTENAANITATPILCRMVIRSDFCKTVSPKQAYLPVYR